MKKIVLVAVCFIAVIFIPGCQEKTRQTPVEVTIKGNGPFPEFLVGTWRAKDAGWEFTFEPDGNISSAVIDNGMVRVNTADKITTIPLINDGQGTYELGQWYVDYSPVDRELMVNVVVDKYHLDMKTYGLEGSSTDLFIGYISDDNLYWTTQWHTFPEIIALLPEPAKLPVSPDDQVRDIVFEKQAQVE